MRFFPPQFLFTELTHQGTVRLKIKEKILIKGLILIFCHGLFLLIYRICPGSGSGFVNIRIRIHFLDPQIRIRITGLRSGGTTCSVFTEEIYT